MIIVRVVVGFAYAMLSLASARHDATLFEESIWLPSRKTDLPKLRLAALQRALHSLHLGAGVSYYKAFAPCPIMLARPICRAEADFFTRLYQRGLAEFAWRNSIDLRQSAIFPASDTAHTDQPPPSPALARRSLIPLGGGKDSIVTLECLRRANERAAVFALRPSAPIRSVGDRASMAAVYAWRRLDPKLAALNAAGAPNGHVPITALVCLIALCAALITGYDRIALSNERSADEANVVTDDGAAINHQYSKSLQFEDDLRRYLADHVTGSVRVSSLLRPLSEVAIARIFSRIDGYDDLFTSCNRSFHLAGSVLPKGRRWCLACPKCRFVYLILAPFMSPERLIGIFGHDLLDDAAQVPGYRELAGLDGHKPFECVGEIAESASSLAILAELPQWRGRVVVKAIGIELAGRRDELMRFRDMSLRRAGHI